MVEDTKCKANVNDVYILKSIADIFTKMNSFAEKINGKMPEIIIFVLYSVLHFVICAFHEPWYDEAVAWMIAKYSSVSNILFEIGHYEGHPQLWFFILMPFARLGVPYEAALNIVSFIFCGLSVYIILFKSPFPRLIRWLLPFTYFYFYQYGVIARPYCIMMLAFLLIAMTYNSRNEKPWRVVASLALLASASAYGIAFAGCMAFLWVIEIIKGRKVKDIIKSIKTDKRVHALSALLLFALCLLAMLMPKEDTYARVIFKNFSGKNSLIFQLFYMIFILPADVTCTNVYSENEFLVLTHFESYELVSAGIIGALIWCALIYFAKKKRLLAELIIPYAGFAVFASCVYFTRHHMGIALLYLVYWAYICINKPVEDNEGKDDTSLSLPDNIITKTSIIAAALMIIMSLFWTVGACVLEIQKTYAFGREEAKFIKDNNLTKYNIMAEWFVEEGNSGNAVYTDPETGEQKIDYSKKRILANYCAFVDNINPYFDKNIFYNYMDGGESDTFLAHKVYPDEYNRNMLEKWKEYGYPDVLVGRPALAAVFGDEIDIKKDYALVFVHPSSMIWKYEREIGWSEIFIRRDLLEESGLEEIIHNNLFYIEE